MSSRRTLPYGALSTRSGKVRLSWDLGADSFVIEWLEMGGPEVRAPSSQGYGMKVIRASFEQLGGCAIFDWRLEGLRCTLSLPQREKLKPANGRDSQTLPEKGTRPQLVGGNAVLLVEDESVVAMMMAEALIELGFRVIGPYSTVAEVMAAKVEMHVDAAILDINLGDELVYPLADVLNANCVPLVFVTGYGIESIDPRYVHVPLLQKPIDRKALQDLFVVSSNPMRGASPQDTLSRATTEARQSTVHDSRCADPLSRA
jgi:CheY-like chemotaxis protein